MAVSKRSLSLVGYLKLGANDTQGKYDINMGGNK
jgi:hypothetical protein